MVGLFEPVAAPWSLDKIPDDFSFGEIPSDWDRLAPFLEYAMEILPGLENVGVRKLFTGPESFTPDNGFLMGEAPELANFFVAAGFNSLGILTGAGAGSIVASWIADGVPPIDVTDVDIARMSPFQTNRPYLAERSVELLGRLHSTGSWPHSHPTTARNVKRSVIHERLEKAGAHFSSASRRPELTSANLLGGKTHPGSPQSTPTSSSNSHTPARTGLSSTPRNTGRSAAPWLCSTCPRCRRSWFRAPTPRRL